MLTQNERKEINKLLKRVEAKARVAVYKGLSHSRLTGEILGASEFKYKGWTWPKDFRPHYVLRFGVKPSDEFLEFIGYSPAKSRLTSVQAGRRKGTTRSSE